jgi:hypothetical protein
MFIIARSPKYALISLAVSIGIFLIIYFTVISPDNNAANKAVSQSEQQLNNAVNNAAKSGGVPKSVTNLTQCMTAAGTDTSKIQACTAKFQP